MATRPCRPHGGSAARARRSSHNAADALHEPERQQGLPGILCTRQRAPSRGRVRHNNSFDWLRRVIDDRPRRAAVAPRVGARSPRRRFFLITTTTIARTPSASPRRRNFQTATGRQGVARCALTKVQRRRRRTARHRTDARTSTDHPARWPKAAHRAGARCFLFARKRQPPSRQTCDFETPASSRTRPPTAVEPPACVAGGSTGLPQRGPPCHAACEGNGATSWGAGVF